MDKIEIQYGRDVVAVYPDRYPEAKWDIFTPKINREKNVGRDEFIRSCKNPIGSRPLDELVDPGDNVVIVTADGTRPVPNRLLIPWILEQLPTSLKNVTILLGNGGHRANTPKELEEMFGPELCDSVNIINHDASDSSMLTKVGNASDGSAVWLNNFYLDADKRIVVGLIEPHFFCGYSGGDKGVVPGVAGMDTILDLHRAELIAHPKSTWGTLEDNPIRQLISEMVDFCPPDFLVNVTLDPLQNIHELFVGDHRQAHKAGCDAVNAQAFAHVKKRYPLVLTCNCGYPLDQNLYQGVKGISCGANIVEPGGDIVLISECSDGYGAHHHFRDIMKSGKTPADVLAGIMNATEVEIDQWQSQVLAQIQTRINTHVFSEMPFDDVSVIHCNPVRDLESFLEEKIAGIAGEARIAVLPAGFQMIPIID